MSIRLFLIATKLEEVCALRKECMLVTTGNKQEDKNSQENIYLKCEKL